MISPSLSMRKEPAAPSSPAKRCAVLPPRRLAQEIEVTALIGAENLVAVEAGIAARRARRDRRLALCQRGGIDEEVEAALADAEANPVAVADEAERAAARGVGRHMEDDGAIGGAAHPRIGDAHHVLD